jgi:hypothetical protein
LKINLYFSFEPPDLVSWLLEGLIVAYNSSEFQISSSTGFHTLVVTFFPRSFALVQLKAKMTFDAAERGLSPASHHILQLSARCWLFVQVLCDKSGCTFTNSSL